MQIAKYKQAVTEKINKLRKTGFFSIFISNVLSKVVVFLGGIVLVRILSQNDYGIYSYAINAFNMLFILNDFGASNAALQNLTEEKNNKKKQQAIIKYSIKMGIIGSLISGGLILISPLFYPYEIEEAKYLTPMLCLVPILTVVMTLFTILLRANFENKKYAVLNLTQTIASYAFLIPMSYLWGIKGAILSRYFYIIVTIILGIFLTRRLRLKTGRENQLTKIEKKSFTRYALITQISNTIGSLLIYIDTFMIGLLIATPESVAIYKVASTIPAALAFLPNCVMVYVIPYFVLHNREPKWLKDKYYKLIKYGIIGYGLFSLVLILGSKIIINTLYTEEYSDAIIPFIILMIGFFFSATFKIPMGNILAALRKMKVKLIINVSSGILNIVLNVSFIKYFGITGAAITTTLINIFSSVLGVMYTNNVLKKMKIEEKEIKNNDKNEEGI